MNNRIIITILFLIGVAYSSIGLIKSEYGLGWDSYFYINQVQSWFDNGFLHSERLNIIYPLLILIQYITHDYILSYKVLSILSFSVYVTLIYVFTRSQTKEIISSFLFFFIFLSSPHLIYFSSQFTKNLIGLIFFIFLLLLLEKDKKIVIVITFILLYFSHKLMFGCSIIFVTHYYLHKYIHSKSLRIVFLLIPSFLFYIACILFKKEMLANWHIPSLSFIASHKQIFTTHWLLFIIGSFFLFLLTSLFICLLYTSPSPRDA